jgi:hypothetical protein
MQSSTEAPDQPVGFSLGWLDPGTPPGFPVTIHGLSTLGLGLWRPKAMGPKSLEPKAQSRQRMQS